MNGRHGSPIHPQGLCRCLVVEADIWDGDCLWPEWTSEAIKQIKAHYMAAPGDAKATHGAAIREVEAAHSASSREVEVICATAVRKVEAASTAQMSKLQQVHQETIQTLEDEAIKEEKHAHQSFLWAFGAALQACPNKALGVLMYPINLLTGNMSLTSLLMAAWQLIIRSRDPIPSPSYPRRPTITTHSTGTKWQHLPGCDVELDPSGDVEPISCPGELPQQRWKEEDPLAEHLRGAPREPFASTPIW